MSDNGFAPRNPYLYPNLERISYPCRHCGKEYTAVHYLNSHQRTGCTSTKRHLSELLGQTKEYWESRKKARTQQHGGDTPVALQLSEPGERSLTTPGPSRDTTRQFSAPSPSTPAGSAEGLDVLANNARDLDIPVAQRKARRKPRLPARFIQDILPEPPLPVEKTSDPNSLAGAVPAELLELLSFLEHARKLVPFKSKPNSFGVMKSYLLPSGFDLTHNPEKIMTLRQLTDTSGTGPSHPSTGAAKGLGPFTSESAFLLADWYWQSTSKSFIDFQKLIQVLRDPRFCHNDATRVNWKETFRVLGANREEMPEDEGAWLSDDGWRKTPVSIDVPFHNRSKDPGIKSFLVGEFRHRSIVSVIKETLTSTTGSTLFHYNPYKATWRPTPESPEVELYGELYASRTFREADEAMQRQPSTPANEGMERVIVALMFWSDGTQLASFGGASIWPCYLFFGNESKYRRCQPSERLGHHVAYFLKLPDKFHDYLRERNRGKLPSDALMKYCHRELFHRQWSILLDDELLEAMKDGMVVSCPDGRRRCFYPRIFSYAADYPEKALISGIRNNGLQPCHRCLVKKVDLWKLGASVDTERFHSHRCQAKQEAAIARARAAIRSGYAVDSDVYVEPELIGESLTPVEIAFTARRGDVAIDIAAALVVDILHEFEIGVWKRLYTHCLRLLKACTSRYTIDFAAELDSRYRSTPAFGRDTIRKFPLNVTEMKRKAARDFEDLLQCAIPAFEGLLPEPFNSSLMALLFLCAQWHALAKLRLHHDRTLDLLDYTTTRLGAAMRHFERDTRSKFETKELEKEAEARVRRNKGQGSTAPRPAALGVFTIKFHYLGDYTHIIRRFGTTDSYSTQIGELYHRFPKSWYSRTDKKDCATQFSRIERRQARLSQIREGLALCEVERTDADEAKLTHMDQEPVPDAPYVMGANQNHPLSLNLFISADREALWNESGVYFTDFIPKLKQHLLMRELKRRGHDIPDPDIVQDRWDQVALRENRLFSHKLLRLNFTTYDVRRDEDVIHLDTHQCNVMLLNKSYTKDCTTPEHQYQYGKVIGIFHANVAYLDTPHLDHRRHHPCLEFHRMDFVWIHWYEFHRSATELTLDHASLEPIWSGTALGFVDPIEILRAVHLIPKFSSGELNPQVPKPPFSTTSSRSWSSYFINRFADRDLFMRYEHGMSVGHTYMFSDDSPPPKVTPVIPNDFDHCLTPPGGELEDHELVSEDGDSCTGSEGEDDRG